MNKKYIVRLTDAEREQLTELTRKGTAAASQIRHAPILSAEIEISVLTMQCLDRRIPDMETLTKETQQWNRGVMRPKKGWTGSAPFRMPASSSNAFTHRFKADRVLVTGEEGR